MKRVEDKLTLAVADCETDPFRVGRTDIKPFAWGIYDGSTYHEFWGDDATAQFLKFLSESDEAYIIYAHNGGKFDWTFLTKYFEGEMQTIGPRIVRARIGKHEFRDSYANMPVPLSKFQDKSVGCKIKFDYSKMERHSRQRYRKEICTYMKQDILVLFNAIERWRQMFGTKALTMASAAMNALTETMKAQDITIGRMNARSDARLRPYYFGGRVECFEKGVVTGDRPLKIHDLNSAYPAAMRDYEHPISAECRTSNTLDDRTDFADITANSQGCLPWRADDGSVRFPHGVMRFMATGHEIRMGIKLGLLKVHVVHSAMRFIERTTFKDFVERFYDLRTMARAELDEMLVLFYKLVMNSAYGKTAIDPKKFTDMVSLPVGELPDGECAGDEAIALVLDQERRLERQRMAWRKTWHLGEKVIWERGTDTNHRYLNVACAASITGATRAMLMEGIAASERPVYCDTDSVICEALHMPIDDTKLGAWKYEGEGDTMFIAGKKMYAIFDKDKCVKKASKGANISAEEIKRVAIGETVTYTSEAPTFKMDGSQVTMQRRIRNTAHIEVHS